MANGYERIYESLVTRLRTCDFPEVAQRLGLTLRADGALAVGFLGREYEISHQGVNPTDDEPVSVNNRSVIAYYALSSGAGEPAFSYVPLSSLAGTAVIANANTNWMTDRLGKAFSGDYGGFCEAMRRLGGIYDGKLESGGYSWLLRALPKIPVQIVYYGRDDDFPCEVQIRFDQNAARFLEFECLAFLQGCLVRAMVMTAQTGGTAGWA